MQHIVEIAVLVILVILQLRYYRQAYKIFDVFKRIFYNAGYSVAQKRGNIWVDPVRKKNVFLGDLGDNCDEGTLVLYKTSDENSEFDFLILCLTKCLIDSLNEKDMKKKLLPQDSDKPGIEKLICFLEGNKIVIEQENISFLKNLQALRSSLSAHRKGERFFKLRKKLGYDKLGNRDVFIDLLNKANLYLDWINEIIKEISV